MKIIHGDCLEEMKRMSDNSIDCIVTDPPYGLSFMGKKWDKEVPSVDYWKEMLRIAKPGSFLLAAGAPRSHHHLAMAIENAGWEITDCIMHLFFSGFPKGKSQLKPAYEPWILARKKADKVQHLNIDDCRILIDPKDKNSRPNGSIAIGESNSDKTFKNISGRNPECLGNTLNLEKGRWPANIILGDEEVETMLDEQSGVLKSGQHDGLMGKLVYRQGTIPQYSKREKDSGGASRFFYCAKASKKERNKGLDCYLTVKYNCDKKGSLCHEENMVAVQLLKKVILDSDQMSFNIEESGESILVQFHKDFSSIIKTKTKQIIESKILNWLMHLLTNESIQDANLLQENGGNLVVDAENLKKWILTITKDNRELALGVSDVVLKMLQLISEEENWKETVSSHPTVKPQKLMEYLIKLVMPKHEGAILLDPFMGSGSTLVACKNLGVSAIGIEMNEEYCEIARKRVA